jgi:5'-nucleotidase
MRILIANDDGIDSPLLANLEAAARRLSDDVWTVAPERKWSGSSHSVSLHKKFAITKLAEKRYRCSGTPVDCVVSAMGWLFRDDTPPDLILSGINDGQNVAEDFAYSGTLSIAREGTFWNIPSIAVSRIKGGGPLDAPQVEWLGRILSVLWNRRPEWQIEGHWLSLNLPAALPAPVRLARVGHDKIARRCEAQTTDGPTTQLVIADGRARTEATDDETALLRAGFCSLVRLNWSDTRPLQQSIADSLDAARGSS